MSKNEAPNPFQAARQVVPILLILAGIACGIWGWQQHQDVAQWSEEEIKASVFLNAKLQRARQQAAAANNATLSIESPEESFARVDLELRSSLNREMQDAQLWMLSAGIFLLLGLLPLIALIRRKYAER